MSDVKIVILTEDQATAKLDQIDAKLSKFQTKFNQDFLKGLERGSAVSKDFGRALVEAGDKANLGASQLSRMAQATGMFTDRQIAAARASAAVAQKADELVSAVARGQMTTREAGRAFAEFSKAQEVAGASTGNLIGNLKNFALQAGLIIGILAAVKIAISKAFEQGEQGAAALQTAASFEILLQKVGAAPDLLKELQTASRGTVADMELMASTSLLLAGTQGKLAQELANASPELLEIAKAAQKLNPKLGDTTFLYDSLARGIKRASPLILDNLGIVISLEQANNRYAESIGKAAGELTVEEQKIALLNEVLRQGSVLISQAGGDAAAMTDSYQHLDAASANLANTLKGRLALALDDVAEGVANYFDALNRNMQARELVDEAEKRGLITHHEAVRMQGAIQRGYLDAAEAAGKLTTQLNLLDSERTAEIAAMRLARQGVAEIAVDYQKAFEDLQLAVAGPLRESSEAYAKQQESLVQKAVDLQEKIARLSELPSLSDKQVAELQGLRTELDQTNAAYDANAAAHTRATQVIIFNLAADRAAQDGITDAEYNLLLRFAEATGIMDQATVQMAQNLDGAMKIVNTDAEAAYQMILRVGEAALAVQGDYWIRFHVSTGEMQVPQYNDVGVGRQVRQATVTKPMPGPTVGGYGVGGGSAAAPAAPKKTQAQILSEVGSALSSLGSTAMQILEKQTLDPLREKLKAIDELIKPGHADMMAVERMAQLTEERADAAKKIKDAEEKILKLQEAQQKLALVEAQMRLLDIIRENKLNAKNILGGIQLGSGANMLSVIEATTRALDAVVGKLDGTLGGGGGGGGGGSLNWKRRYDLPAEMWDDAASWSEEEKNAWIAEERRRKKQGAAFGMNLTIPPGYPNDTYGPVYFSSGEKVLAFTGSGRIPGLDGATGAGTVHIEKVEIILPVQGINSIVDWEDGARRIGQIFRIRG